jgi:hypothetical protein
MNVTHLIGVHKARIAHHVAAVGQIHCQDSAAPELDVGRAMAMNVRVFGGAKVTTEEERFDSFKKSRIGRHHVCELAMFRASLAHDDLAILFQNLCLDFARMLVHQGLKRGLTRNDRIANFLDATRAQAIGLPRKTKRRGGALIGFQKRFSRPLWANRFTFGQAFVDRLKDLPRGIRKSRDQLRASHSAESLLL